jgi:hypothetical protein
MRFPLSRKKYVPNDGNDNDANNNDNDDEDKNKDNNNDVGDGEDKNNDIDDDEDDIENNDNNLLMIPTLGSGLTSHSTFGKYWINTKFQT